MVITGPYEVNDWDLKNTDKYKIVGDLIVNGNLNLKTNRNHSNW